MVLLRDMATCQSNTEDGSRSRPFTIRQGLTLPLEITGRTSVGGVLDLTGRTGAGDLKQNIEDEIAVATFTVTITEPTRGVATAELGADVTAGLSPGLYVASFEFTLSATDVVGTDPLYVQITR